MKTQTIKKIEKHWKALIKTLDEGNVDTHDVLKWAERYFPALIEIAKLAAEKGEWLASEFEDFKLRCAVKRLLRLKEEENKNAK